MTTRVATPDILGTILASNSGAPVAAPAQRTLLLAQIRRDGGTQPREGIDWDHVKDMQQALADGAALPAISVIYDGADYWLWDGFHRWHAYANTGKIEIPVVISQGTQDDAQWESFAANQAHGLKRTPSEKERAIRGALKHPKSAGMSNMAIAKHLGVSDKTVAQYREKMELSSEIPKIATRTVERNGQTYQQNTTNIGANRPQPPAAHQSEPIQYAEIWKLQSIVRGLAMSPDQFGAFDAKTMAELLRRAAANRSDDFWNACIRSIQKQRLTHRTSDLVQAINNFAAQVEAQYNGTNAQPNPILRTVSAPRTAPPAEDEELDAQDDRPLYDFYADTSIAVGALEKTLQDLAEPEQPAAPTGKLLIDYTEDDWAAARVAEKQRIASATPVAEPVEVSVDDVRANRETLRNDLDQELTDALLRYYWSKSELNSFAGSATPFEDCRRRLVSSSRGMATRTWRIDTRQGRVYAWHVSRGEDYFHREPPDAVFTYDRFARMTVGLPEVQQIQATVAASTDTPVSQRADYESDEWYTPAEYIDAAKAVMGAIDLDPASSEMAQTVVRAGVYLTRFDDGLAQTRWIHQRIWLNPPYSNPGPWIEKLVREHQAGPFCTEAIVLVNNATETSWFQLLLERFPVCLPARRLAFWRHDHANVGARQGQAFFYLGPNDDRFEEVFRQFGPILRRVS